jgi:hypothetical protein
VSIKQIKGIKCADCGGRIPASESDIVLRKLDSEKLRFYHERCAGSMQKFMLSNPTRVADHAPARRRGHDLRCP